MPTNGKEYQQLVLEVTCRNIVRSTTFYRSLGFELIRAEEHFAALAWEGCPFLLEERPTYLPTGLPAGNVRVMVKDVDAVWQRCVDLGVPVFAPIENRYYGLRDFTILDPDGFGIRFAMPIPAAT